MERTISLKGRIDSVNAQLTEQEILKQLEGDKDCGLVLDMHQLKYISSAGLRVLLRLRKDHRDMRITGVNPEIYEILDMTGFTEMIPVQKAYRVVSIEGCEEIGHGANGTIYRIDQDNVVKVYNNPDALDDIQHEREVAKLALVLGLPTAISYDVVKVGNSYGSVFELLNAQSFSKILSTQPEKMDWCVKEFSQMLRRIHQTLVPAGKLPDVRKTALSWAAFVQDWLPEESGKKLISLVEAVPHDDHMIHGDYHTKNLVLQGDEVLIIDMDTLSVGHPIFELGSIYNALVGFHEFDHSTSLAFLEFDWETARSFWHRFLSDYLETDDEAIIRDVENKARIVGYTRIIRRSIRRGGLETEKGRAEIDMWKGSLIRLLAENDTLLFSLR